MKTNRGQLSIERKFEFEKFFAELREKFPEFEAFTLIAYHSETGSAAILTNGCMRCASDFFDAWLDRNNIEHDSEPRKEMAN